MTVPDSLKKVRVIIVDDSFSFRWILRDIFESAPMIEIVGEATNGIEALELIIKLQPDVILMDVEMPLMDGMTALQHLMIHTPTPTIMFSRLTREGTARCFDALKNGAVDFFCKDNFHPGKVAASLQAKIINMVVCASLMSVTAVEPVFPNDSQKDSVPKQMTRIVFCEECGWQKATNSTMTNAQKTIVCSNCGEHMLLDPGSKNIRTNCVSIIAAGEGAYINLLKFIPLLQPGLTGALLILIDGKADHVDAFSDYLDAISPISVIRIRDDLCIYGGNCYVGCDNERIYLKPFSAHYTLKFEEKASAIEPMDLTLISFVKIFKNRTAVVFLSGDERKGEKGVEAILGGGGTALALDTPKCLYKKMVQNIQTNFPVITIDDEDQLSKKITSMHQYAKNGIFTA